MFWSFKILELGYTGKAELQQIDPLRRPFDHMKSLLEMIDPKDLKVVHTLIICWTWLDGAAVCAIYALYRRNNLICPHKVDTCF